MLESKAKLAQKQYGIVVLEIFIAKIDLKKAKEKKEKIIIYNASICANIKIENIFWLFILKKNKHTLSIIIKVNNAKMTNMLIQKKLFLDHILHRYMRNNFIYRIKQYFNFYKYDYILVYY